MAARPTVYYDGGCPVCSHEIGFYQRRSSAKSLDWVDVTQADEAALGLGLSREASLARIHVRRADGTVVDGAAAFAEIWRGMPGLRWLVLVLAVPPFSAIAYFCGRERSGADKQFGAGMTKTVFVAGVSGIVGRVAASLPLDQ